MLTKGPAKKVTIFINEDTQHHMMALHDSIMTYLMHKGVSGATATRAYSGFGSHQMMHTPEGRSTGAAPAHPHRIHRDAGESRRDPAGVV